MRSGWWRRSARRGCAISDIHASLRGAAVGTITGSFPPSAWCGSEVAGVVCVFGGCSGQGGRCIVVLARRLPSPCVLGPFEAVFQIGAGAPYRVTPVAAACACVSLLYWPGLWRAACLVPSVGGAASGGGQRMKVMYERVAGIDVHKDMIKVAIRSLGEKPWTRKTGIFEFRTFYGVLQEVARELRRRGVTHVVMEASGVCTEPVYYALAGQDFTEVAVINPAHAKALKGHKTDAKDCARLAGLFECGLLRGAYIPAPELKEVRDLTRYRIKTVQARTSEIQRLGKALESAGIKLGSVASSITGTSSTAMIEALTGGERRGAVLADLAIGRMRTAGKLAGLSMALAGRFTDHHALLCRLHLDRIKTFDDAAGGLEDQIAGKAAPWQREAGLLKTLPGFGDVVAQAWLAEIGPAPHLHFSSHEKLASWVTLCPGNNISAKKRKHGRTGDAGTYIKPMLVQAAWNAIRVRGRLQARYSRLVRRFGGQKNPAAKKKAITAIAHTLLKIAYQVLKSGTPYQDLGADFYTRRESPEQKQAYLERQLQKLHPGCTITITISPPAGRLNPRHLAASPPPAQPRSRPTRHPGPPAGQPDAFPAPSPPFRPRVRCRAPYQDPVIVSGRRVLVARAAILRLACTGDGVCTVECGYIRRYSRP